MLASLPVVWWTASAARRYDLGKVRIGLVLATLFNAAFVGAPRSSSCSCRST